MPAVHELYVYYKVRIGSEGAALGIVEAFQARLRQQQPGLQARLLRRPVHAGAAQTWMETYAMTGDHAGESVGAERQRLIEAAAAPLAACLDGPRHTEAFEPVASPSKST